MFLVVFSLSIIIFIFMVVISSACNHVFSSFLCTDFAGQSVASVFIHQLVIKITKFLNTRVIAI